MYSQIGDLILIDFLGKGSFGNVSLYKKVNTNKLFAVKVIDKLKAEYKGISQYLKSEINILRILDHPNIIKFEKIIENQNNLIIIMEYCNGGSLSECLNKYKDKNHTKGFPEEIIQHLMRQIVNALVYIHSKNIIHRDLKLQNIMVHFDNEPDKINLKMMKAKIKIIDFGLSKQLSANSLTNTILGTVNYMAPKILEQHYRLKLKEKIEKTIGYGKEVDIWALGCICYQLLRGRKVFEANYESDLIEQMKDGNYKLPKTVSLEYISFLNSMLQYEGKNRITAKELLQKSFLIKEVKYFSSYKDEELKIKRANKLSELNKSFISFKEKFIQKNYKKYNSFDSKPIPEESIESQNTTHNQKMPINQSYNYDGGYSFYGQPMSDNSSNPEPQYFKSNSQPINHTSYQPINHMQLNNSYVPIYNRTHSSNQIQYNNYNLNNSNSNYYIQYSNDESRNSPPFGHYNSGPIHQKEDEDDCIIF